MNETGYHIALAVSLFAYLATCAVYLYSRQASIRHPATFYLVFHGFVFVFRPFAALYYDYEMVYRLFQFMPSYADKINAIGAATVAMIVFTAVSMAVCARAAAERPADLPDFAGLRQRIREPLLLLAACLTPFAVWSAATNWSIRAGNYDTMIRDPETGALLNTVSSGWFTDLALVLAPLAVLIVWVSRYRWWGWAYFAGFVLLQSGGGTRGPIIFALEALVLIWLTERGRRWPSWQTIAPALFAIILFNLVVTDRGRAVREVFVDESGASYSVEEDLAPLEHMDFANLEYLEYLTFAVPKRTGTYDYFAANLQIFTAPIPRTWWPDKPAGSPIQNFSLFDYGRPVGMTASVAGHGWMAWGYPGVVIHTALFALFYAWLFRSLVLMRRDAALQLVYILMISATTLTLRDGSFLTIVRLLPFYLGPLLLALLGVRLVDIRTDPIGSGPAPALSPAERRRLLARRAEAADKHRAG